MFHGFGDGIGRCAFSVKVILGDQGNGDLGCRFWKMRIFRFSVFENSYCCWLGDGLYVMQCVAIFVCLGVKVSDDVFGKTNKNRYRGQ